MSRQLLLVLSGGGALGAYECGVYRTLWRAFDHRVIRSMLIVGASSGAINALLIARHCQDPDGGVGVLERFWRSLASPPLPFFPVPHPYWRRMNSTLTGLLFGNAAVFQRVPGGALGACAAYPLAAPYRLDPLLVTLQRWAGAYRSDADSPRVVIRALDAEAAEPRWYDSAREAIEPEVVVGSSSIPLVFPPFWHNGRALWDGDVWIRGLLTEALGDLMTEPSRLPGRIVSVELMASRRAMPIGIPQTLLHLRDMMLGGRHDKDGSFSALADRDIRLTRIQRRPHPYEEVSSALFDWGPDRIEALMEQGERDAEAALASSELQEAPERDEARSEK